MSLQRLPIRCTAATLVAIALSALPAPGAQRVSLRTGTDVVCDHQRLVNGQMRLFLTAAEDSYLDIDPLDVVHTEIVPDEVPSTQAQPAASVAVQQDVPTLLAHAATAHHIDVDLLASVVRAESGGNPRAVSRAGAQGLMQLMPATAAKLGVDDSFVPSQNVAGGTAYLDALLTRYHDNLALALAAYNAGPEAVDRYHGIPPYPETRRYVAHIIHDFNRRKLQQAAEHDREQARRQMATADVPQQNGNR